MVNKGEIAYRWWELGPNICSPSRSYIPAKLTKPDFEKFEFKAKLS